MSDNGSPIGVLAPAEEAGSWLTAIADSADDAIVGKDLRGTVIFWNRAAEALFGYGGSETPERRAQALISCSWNCVLRVAGFGARSL